MYSKPFHFSDEEAKIVARWEIGVRNIATPVTALLFALLFLISLARYYFRTQIPGIWWLVSYVAFALVFVLILNYIGRRVNMTAAEIVKRELAVDFSEDGAYVAVVEYGDKTVFRTLNSDIFEIDAGPNVVRIHSRSGAVCLPRAQVPDDFIAQMQKQLGPKNFRVRKWM